MRRLERSTRSLATLYSVTIVAISLGCASTYHDSWEDQNPGWVDTFPDRGTSLHETLAGMTAPRRSDDMLSVGKLDVLALEGSTARSLSDDEVATAITQEQMGDFGIVAILRCQSEVDVHRYYGEKVSWVLLIDGEANAWDVPEFGHRCLVSHNFVPASAEHMEPEHLVTSHRDAEFPRGMENVGEMYSKGIKYLGAGRLADAEDALARGDAIVDVGSTGHGPSVRGEGPASQTRSATKSQIERIRNLLMAGIAAGHVAESRQDPPPP